MDWQIMKKEPTVEACLAIVETMGAGSTKDGINESWRGKSPMYHLSKAQAHLATHIRNLHDSRKADDENHIHEAITRIAMALSL